MYEQILNGEQSHIKTVKHEVLKNSFCDLQTKSVFSLLVDENTSLRQLYRNGK